MEGRLEAIHVLLDKGQLETLKGLVEMNLGEGIEEFEKPSSVIHDPIAEVRAGGILICCILCYTSTRGHICCIVLPVQHGKLLRRSEKIVL